MDQLREIGGMSVDQMGVGHTSQVERGAGDERRRDGRGTQSGEGWTRSAS